MSKQAGPITRIWHGSLLLLGSAIAISLTLQLLASIWLWLVLIAVIAAVVGALIVWLRARRSNW